MAGPQQQSAEFIVSLIDKFTVNADTIARSVTSLNTHVEASGNQFKKFSRDFSENMENIKKGAELLGEVGITLIGVRESLEAGARMTGAITDIGQSARLSGERLKGLTENIDTLGERWATSNEGIANAAKNLSQDVVQNAKTFDTIMDASLQFATSTTNNYQDRITRLGEITASVQPIMHGFGVSAEGVSDVFDAIRATADASNIPVNTFMQNLGQMSSEAKELGYSGVKGVREFGTDVALLARSTGDAQGAFNKTFQIINRLMRPEDFVGLRQIGVNMRDVMTFASAHNMDPLLASIQAIRQRMIDMGLTAQGQTLVLEKLLGGRGLAGAFLSVSDQISHMGVIQDQIFKSHNLNARDAAEKTQLWTFAWQRLTGSIDHLFTDTLGEDIGKGLAPFVLQMDHLVEGVAHFTEANPAFTQGVVDIGLAFAGIKLVETAIGVAKLASSLKILFGLTPPKWFLPVVALMETYELNKEASGGNDIPSLWGRLQSDAAKDFGGGRAPAAGVSPTWAIPNVRGRRATGGPVSGGAAYVVGENGPEVFVPGMNGSIMPNGGGGSNIEAAIFRGVSEGTKTGIKDGLREFFLSGLGRMAGGYTNGAIGPIAALSGASGDWGGSVARSAGSSPRFSGPVRAARVKGGAAAHALMDVLSTCMGGHPKPRQSLRPMRTAKAASIPTRSVTAVSAMVCSSGIRTGSQGCKSMQTSVARTGMTLTRKSITSRRKRRSASMVLIG